MKRWFYNSLSFACVVFSTILTQVGKKLTSATRPPLLFMAIRAISAKSILYTSEYKGGGIQQHHLVKVYSCKLLLVKLYKYSEQQGKRWLLVVKHLLSFLHDRKHTRWIYLYSSNTDGEKKSDDPLGGSWVTVSINLSQMALNMDLGWQGEVCYSKSTSSRMVLSTAEIPIR